MILFSGGNFYVYAKVYCVKKVSVLDLHLLYNTMYLLGIYSCEGRHNYLYMYMFVLLVCYLFLLFSKD